MADFATIKAQVSIVQALEMLGIAHLTERGDMLRGACPICKASNGSAFVVTPAKNIFYCFAEKKGGSIIDLVAKCKSITEAQAGQQIAAHFGLNGAAQGACKAADNPPPRHEPEVDRKAAGFDPLEYHRSLDPSHAGLKDCGIPPATIRDFDGGYCSKGLNRGRLTLPVHDAGGSILGFMGLALKGEQPEIQFPKAFEPPAFFNIHRAAKQRSGSLFIVATPLDVLRAWDNGLLDVICPLVPVTAPVLDQLAAFMRERDIAELEWY
jgi:DNA primase